MIAWPLISSALLVITGSDVVKGAQADGNADKWHDNPAGIVHRTLTPRDPQRTSAPPSPTLKYPMGPPVCANAFRGSAPCGQMFAGSATTTEGRQGCAPTFEPAQSLLSVPFTTLGYAVL